MHVPAKLVPLLLEKRKEEALHEVIQDEFDCLRRRVGPGEHFHHVGGTAPRRVDPVERDLVLRDRAPHPQRLGVLLLHNVLEHDAQTALGRELQRIHAIHIKLDEPSTRAHGEQRAVGAYRGR